MWDQKRFLKESSSEKKNTSRKTLLAELYTCIYDYWKLSVLCFLYMQGHFKPSKSSGKNNQHVFSHTLVIVNYTESFNISFCDGRWQFFYTMDANWPGFFVFCFKSRGGEKHEVLLATFRSKLFDRRLNWYLIPNRLIWSTHSVYCDRVSMLFPVTSALNHKCPQYLWYGQPITE